MNVFPDLTSEFQIAPVRQRKLLAQLARCQFCSRLCCCVKHRIEHERGHLSENCEKVVSTTVQSSILKNSNSTFQEKREWIPSSDPAFASNLNWRNFPYVCIYCKRVVDSEVHLKLLLKSGLQCPSKESHWIVPLRTYTDNNNRKINLIMEETTTRKSEPERKKGKDSSYLMETTPVSSQNKSVRTLQNEDITPQQQFLSQLHLKHETGPLLLTKELSFHTSTPQESTKFGKIPEMLHINFTPKCGQNIPGILCDSTGSQKSMENSARRVTFSSDLKYIDCGSNNLSKNKSHYDRNNLKLEGSSNIDERNKVGDIIETEQLYTPLADRNDTNSDDGKGLLESNVDISLSNTQASNGPSKQQDEENTIQFATYLADSFQTQEVDQEKCGCLKNVAEDNSIAEQEKGEHKEEDEILVSKTVVVQCSPHSCKENENQRHEGEKLNDSIIGIKTDCSSDQECQKNLSEVRDSIESLTDSNMQVSFSFVSKTNSVDTDYSTVDCTHFADYDFTDASNILSEDEVEVEDQGNKPNSKFNINGSYTPMEGDAQEMSCLSQQNDFIDNTIDSTTSPTQLIVNQDICYLPINEASLDNFQNIQPSCSSEEQNIKPVEEIKSSLETGDTSFRKITTAISSSWTLARKILSNTLGRKRVGLDCSDVGSENKPPEKRMKLCDTTCPDLSSPEANKFPVKWKCRPRPESVYNYKIRARRPLPRMRKSP